MKAKKRQPLDFSALADPPGPPSPTAAPEAAPEATPDLDLSIADAPGEPMPPFVEPALSLGDVKPLAALRQEAERARDGMAMTRHDPPPKPRASASAKPAETGGVAVYAAATLVAALWALGPIAFAVGYRHSASPLQNDDFAMIVFALLAIGPAAFVFFAAYLIRQGARLSAESRRTRELSDQMLTPAALAVAGAADAVAEVRAQIEHAAGMASDARDKMLAMREVLAQDAAALAQATAGSAASTAEMAGNVAREREAMQLLAATLDAQSAAITDAIGRQARMVAEASDLAETQLREAEAALAARAADLAGAVTTASDVARSGAEDLARQAARLETAGHGVVDQLRTVDEGLAQQRAALVQVADALRVDQEDFAVQTETRTAQMADLTAQARQNAEDLGDAALQGAESLRGLIATAVEQFRLMAESARQEREALGQTAAESFESLRRVVGDQRASLELEMRAAIEALGVAAEQARQAAQGQVDAAKVKVDQLNEAAFSAGQRADAVFESRMQEARELIERSAMMAEQAGARSAQRLDEGVTAARAAVGEVERLLADVGARTGALSQDALSQAAAVREVLEQGMGELLASARRAAEETRAIDAAFQERIKRNYDTLSEAVSMMAAAGASPVNGSPMRVPVAPVAPPAAAPAASPAAADEGPRQRLRLTPTTSDEEFRNVFVNEPPGPAAKPPAASADEAVLSLTTPAPPGDPSSWTWKDLLSGLARNSPADEPAPARATAPVEGASSSEVPSAGRLAGEISQMGIDSSALLPRARIDEIAAAVQTGDGRGAREVVKRLAPAAIRRLVRRLFSDRALRDEADRFMSRYGEMVRTAAEQDRKGFLVATLLGSQAGRTYLLLDAATGDIG